MHRRSSVPQLLAHASLDLDLSPLATDLSVGSSMAALATDEGGLGAAPRNNS
jgi:hypothetical protein